MRAVLVMLAAVVFAFPVFSEPLRFSQAPRELGPIVARELTVRDGKLSFRVDSGGCSDTGSFRVDVLKGEGVSPRVPHYRLTIQRVRIDDCKALLLDGVLIELDLEKDLGLKGNYTVSVENPVLSSPAGSP